MLVALALASCISRGRELRHPSCRLQHGACVKSSCFQGSVSGNERGERAGAACDSCRGGGSMRFVAGVRISIVAARR